MLKKHLCHFPENTCVQHSIYLQQFDNEFLSQGSNTGGHVVLVLLDPGVSVLQRLSLERRLAHQQSV